MRAGAVGGGELVSGKTLGIDATTLEVNPAMRSICAAGRGRGLHGVPDPSGAGIGHRASGIGHRASGIGTPTAEDLARFDKKRKKKTSNKTGLETYLELMRAS